jgi:hypothetical protein
MLLHSRFRGTKSASANLNLSKIMLFIHKSSARCRRNKKSRLRFCLSFRSLTPSLSELLCLFSLSSTTWNFNGSTVLCRTYIPARVLCKYVNPLLHTGIRVMPSQMGLTLPHQKYMFWLREALILKIAFC